MTVDYVTVDQTAIAGKDFVETRGQLTFEPCVSASHCVTVNVAATHHVNRLGVGSRYMTERLITVPLIDDQQWEKDATFLIKLVSTASTPRMLCSGVLLAFSLGSSTMAHGVHHGYAVRTPADSRVLATSHGALRTDESTSGLCRLGFNLASDPRRPGRVCGDNNR